MVRVCQPELLDHLPINDPTAIGSRRDLRRVNAWMGNARFMACALNSAFPNAAPRALLEIGAGDGTFFFQVAKRLRWSATGNTISFLDRQNLLDEHTRRDLHRAGWHAEILCTDVFQHFPAVLNRNTGPDYDAIIANLFLHHFSDEQLTQLFNLVRQKTDVFIAVEPRRWPLSILGGKALWAIGCNSVTRHDARVSIRAGFTNHELSNLWGRDSSWTCEERLAGFSSHLFVAAKTNSP
jgi:hypothetical protein